MRKGTKSFISILSLGVVAAGYQAGQAAQISSGFSAAAAPIAAGSAAPISAATASAVPTESATASPSAAATSPTAAAVAPATPKAKTSSAPVAAPASTPKATAAPAATTTPAAPAAPAPAASTSVTKNGTAVSYRYGTVQVSVTKASGKITAVNLLQAGATGGRQSAFSYLVQYAIQANGSGFGNLGGATYTTDAFKQSLEAALAKF